MESWTTGLIPTIVAVVILFVGIRSARNAKHGRLLTLGWMASGVLAAAVILVVGYSSEGNEWRVSRAVVFLWSLPFAVFAGTSFALMRSGLWAPVPTSAMGFQRFISWYKRAVWVGAVLLTGYVFGVLWFHFILDWL